MANYGSAPYEETAFKKALRLLTAGAAGWGAVRPGSNFGEAFLSAGGRSAIAAQQAQQAAQDYAVRQEEIKRRREEDAMQREVRLADIEASKKPPSIPSKQQDYEHLISLGRSPDEARQIVYGLTMDEQTKQKTITSQSSDSETEMSEPSLRIAAEVYLKTGQLPSMGMGKSGVKNRTRILNMAASMRPGAHVADNTASYRAGQRALSDLNLQKNRLQSFENTAAQNTKIIWDFIDRVPETGTRFGNKWSRWLANQSGNPDVASFMAAVNVVMNEYARIVTQFGGTNIMTDTARKEMERVISGDFTKKQLISVMKTIQRDADNRIMSTDQQIRQIQGDIGGIGAEGGGGPADLIYNPKTGELEPAR